MRVSYLIPQTSVKICNFASGNIIKYHSRNQIHEENSFTLLNKNSEKFLKVSIQKIVAISKIFYKKNCIYFFIKIFVVKNLLYLMHKQ